MAPDSLDERCRRVDRRNGVLCAVVSDCTWPLVFLKEEGRYTGFHNSTSTLPDVRTKSQGKTFLNFDDAAYSAGMQAFLAEHFPEPSKFEC